MTIEKKVIIFYLLHEKTYLIHVRLNFVMEDSIKVLINTGQRRQQKST